MFLILCGGSRSDLPEQSPARAAGTTAVISTGWDPGLFSLSRVFGEAILAQGSTHTFWGRGHSQCHSDALRRVPGVVRADIVNMPDYFEPFDTTVHFISEHDLARDHRGKPHGGFVIRSGTTAEGTAQVIEYSLALDSNPEFTASVLVAYARAAARMNRAREVGAKTVYDVAPGLLSPLSAEELRAGHL